MFRILACSTNSVYRADQRKSLETHKAINCYVLGQVYTLQVFLNVENIFIFVFISDISTFLDREIFISVPETALIVLISVLSLSQEGL